MEALLQSHETRLTRVEDTLIAMNERLARLETIVEEIRATMVTKAELAAAISSSPPTILGK